MKRFNQEPYEAYRKRRKETQRLIKNFLKGRKVWEGINRNGGNTYSFAKHGELK